ncbi:ABC transporter ATP-binding protein [Tepidimicrobium xylanilyticum]|uniref:Nickel import system ATP-binding protein NikD n=1 Tax=Tepidimicrobium xylanilyticum TaxID=1123352 RepID=A0A1H3DDZ0_9FIRM|nr:ABC transporter ATP-binding protein [Tepidimicrobium xylanilyticum]GMG97377.1 ABC transporter ATP-binding protein [Tepidimicrobium xylanilyticum]SDX64722.1 peptide/nickel transport system ATP-binding protein [Tepidimicrobium xylanilyticum]
MTLLKMQHLNITYKTQEKAIKAVRDFDLNIELQDSMGIVGESGSGKSTLAMAVLQLLPKDITDISGEIIFNGIDLLKLNSEELKGIKWKEIAYVFQKSMNSLSPVHKIGYQLSDVYKVHEPNANKRQIRERVCELFELVNLPSRVYDLYPHELSGGMMQRVSIALSLIYYPKVLILDESTTALDVVTQRQILEEIMKLQEKLNLTRIMITHDVSIVASTCNKIAVMYAGYLLESGYVTDVLHSPKHPYTEELLNSYPSLRGEKGYLKGIPGYLPDLSQEHKGCIFADRCRKAMEKCFYNRPEMVEFSNQWKVACHLAGSEYSE